MSFPHRGEKGMLVAKSDSTANGNGQQVPTQGDGKPGGPAAPQNGEVKASAKKKTSPKNTGVAAMAQQPKATDADGPV